MLPCFCGPHRRALASLRRLEATVEKNDRPVASARERRFGGPDLFEVREVERPSPGPGEVLVRVLAISVIPVDVKLRADGRLAELQPPVILGYDVAGVIEEIGAGVSALSLPANPLTSPSRRPAPSRSLAARSGRSSSGGLPCAQARPC